MLIKEVIVFIVGTHTT